MGSALLPLYNRLPIRFSRGERVWLYDEYGTPYLDGISGLGVVSLGHSHPLLVAALTQQASHLMHVSNMYHIPLQEKLAEALVEESGLFQAFFCNSGAEANETAIKISRLYASAQGIENPVVLVLENGFHGRTFGAMSAAGNARIKMGFAPMLPGFKVLPFNQLSPLEHFIQSEQSKSVVAVLCEMVQGEGGVHVMSHAYAQRLSEIALQRQWLFMIDEVQSGMCRTGSWFAYQNYGIQPDVVTLAKGLGNGFPIGACLVNKKTSLVVKPGQHGSTFGGNPLACRIALEVIQIMESESAFECAKRYGAIALEKLQHQLEGIPGIVDIRGLGLMVGVELDRECGAIVQHGIDAKILLNVTAGKVIRLLPPFVLKEDELHLLLDTTITIIKAFLTKQ